MTPSEFKVLFPAFADEDEGRIAIVIASAKPYFDVARWGAFYSDGLGNWTAHKIALANALAGQGSGSKTLSSDIITKSVGDVSVGRDSALLNMSAKNPFMRTIYGQEYSRLARQVGMGATTT